jgi:hypothetical protein
MRVSANRSAGAGGDEHTFAHSDRFHVAWLFRATLGPSRTYAARHKAGVDKVTVRQHHSEISSLLVSLRRCRRSLQIKPHPLLGSHLFGPRLIDIRAYELVQRPDDLVILVGTTLGSFAG